MENQILFLSVFLWLLGCQNHIGTQTTVTRALDELSKKDYANAYVVCSDEKSGRFVQFYVSEHDVFFDLPLGAQIRERHSTTRDKAKADSISGGLVFVSYVSPGIRAKLAEVLTTSGFSFRLETVALIDPSVSRTDTTGWVTSYRGRLEGHARGFDLVNSLFQNAYGLAGGSYAINLEEN